VTLQDRLRPAEPARKPEWVRRMEERREETLRRTGRDRVADKDLTNDR